MVRMPLGMIPLILPMRGVQSYFRWALVEVARSMESRARDLVSSVEVVSVAVMVPWRGQRLLEWRVPRRSGSRVVAMSPLDWLESRWNSSRSTVLLLRGSSANGPVVDGAGGGFGLKT
jgi:hypothetical protein